MFANINLNYIVALLMSTTKRSFAQMAKIIGVHQATMRRQIPSSESSFSCLKTLAQRLFNTDKTICLAFDDSKINKMHSQLMQGAAKFFFEKFGRRFMAFKIIVAALTNGKNIIPIHFDYMNAVEYTELDPELQKFNKATYMKTMYEETKLLFPNKEIVIVADGLFATIDVLKFVTDNNIKAVFRCAKNRKILYQNQKISIDNINDLKCAKNQKTRTIQALWHSMNLYFSSVQRVDKHQEVSTVYLVSTFVNEQQPEFLIQLYQQRWMIEKLFRTTKQSLGLGECFSRVLSKQRDHVAAVFLTYSILQLQQKKTCAVSPEEAKRQISSRNVNILKSRISSLNRMFERFYA